MGAGKQIGTKDMFRNLAASIFVAPLMMGVMTQSAHAYLDPGTGSMILQVALGGVAGAAVVIKLYWYRFKELTGLARAGIGAPDSQRNDRT